MSDTKKIFVNGKEVQPCKKAKLPPGFDWAALVKAKQAEG